jgi:UDP-N-acetylmuramoylalanine-D-glutamate ligase
MEINWDPKVKGAGPGAEPQTSPADSPKRDAEPARQPEAMEKPRMLQTPQRADTHPARRQQAARPAPFETRIQQLEQALRRSGPKQADAATQALALAASYGMRRSRGGRRQAIELCEQVAEAVEAYAELAERLAIVLRAEGDLHETTADGTLRALRDLVGLVADDEESEA